MGNPVLQLFGVYHAHAAGDRLANVFAPVGAGILYEQFASYQPVIVVLIGFTLLATGAIVMARRSAMVTT